jgi:uncharacterized protein (TIGR02453 family)
MQKMDSRKPPAVKKPSSPVSRARLSRRPGVQEAAAKPYFNQAALAFLRKLERNNRRDWFDPRKAEYERELKKPMLVLIEVITQSMTRFAPEHVRPAQKCMMRIYRDIRFSSDKRPYKTHVAAWWSSAGLEKTSGAGYYVHVSPKEVVVAAGVYMPEREQLRAIRTYLLEHHAEVRRLLEGKKLRGLMHSFSGMPLSRPPKGFAKEHPGMDLILCRQWGLSGRLAPQAALKRNFSREVIRRFELAAPLVDALNAALVRPLEKKRRPIF